MARSFQYEWWTVDVLEPTGRIGLQVKAKDRDHAIKQIEKEVKAGERSKELGLTIFDKKWKQQILQVYWETLTLDRKGYNRLY